MENKEGKQSRQEKFDVFYQMYFQKSNIQIGYNICMYVVLFILGVFLLIPYQAIAGEDASLAGVPLLCSVLCSFLYVAPYLNYADGDGMIVSLRSRLKYLPFSHKDLQQYVIKKYVGFQLKVYCILQMLQLIFAVIVYHRIVPENILYPLIIVLLIPLIVRIVFSILK